MGHRDKRIGDPTSTASDSGSAQILSQDDQQCQSQDSNLLSESNINTTPEKDREGESAPIQLDTVDEQSAINNIVDTQESEDDGTHGTKSKFKSLHKKNKLKNNVSLSRLNSKKNKLEEKKETMSKKRTKPKPLTPLGIQMLRDKYFSSKACASIESFVTCPVCNRLFDNISFEEHFRTQHAHKKPKLHTCEVCHQTFHLRTELRKHLNTHTEYRPFKCLECSKSFATQYSLNKHMMYHSGQRHHMCSICGSTFWHATHLKVHTMIHTGEAPFKCPDCPRRFKTAGTMRKHRVVHSSDRPNLCSECGKTFKLIQGLKQHVKKVHKRFKLCKSSFQRMERPRTEEEVYEAYPYQANNTGEHIEPPTKIEDTVCDTDTYDYGITMNEEDPKLEVPIDSSYEDQNYTQFSDMSNRASHYFLPAEQSSAYTFQNQQVVGRDSINVFDKWE